MCRDTVFSIIVREYRESRGDVYQIGCRSQVHSFSVGVAIFPKDKVGVDSEDKEFVLKSHQSTPLSGH